VKGKQSIARRIYVALWLAVVQYQATKEI